MAFIKCKNCGKQISDKVERCPRCGVVQKINIEQTKSQPEDNTAKETEVNDITIEAPDKKIRLILTLSIIAAVLIIGYFCLYVKKPGESSDNNYQNPLYSSVKDQISQLPVVEDITEEDIVVDEITDGQETEQNEKQEPAQNVIN